MPMMNAEERGNASREEEDRCAARARCEVVVRRRREGNCVWSIKRARQTRSGAARWYERRMQAGRGERE